jgi:hypothetical protein
MPKRKALREAVLQQLLESPQPVRETRTVLKVDREKWRMWWGS